MPAGTTMVTVEVRQGESLHFSGGPVTVEILEKSGRTARLRVSAPKEVLVERRGERSHQACDSSTSEVPG